MSSNRQVYSTDKTLRKCPVCEEILTECTCQKEEEVVPSKISAALSLEKSGRNGKTVTLIARLPQSSNFLKDLLSELKQKCGAGGTSYLDGKKGGCIEIQGDHRDRVRAFFVAKNFRIKN
ncbi:MAG: translation initiation factor [Oligoflexales bacterium]|nr:translation initiation factor [Oligoflexales bacterium]